MAKLLRDILEQSKYDKVKALYDNPGTPGEKAAAKAAMDRMKASNKPSDSSIDHKGSSGSVNGSKMPKGFYVHQTDPDVDDSDYHGPHKDEKKAHEYKKWMDGFYKAGNIKHKVVSHNGSGWWKTHDDKGGTSKHDFDKKAGHLSNEN